MGGKWTTSIMLILLSISLVIGGCSSNNEYSLTLNVSGQGVTAPNTGAHKYKQGEATVIRARANNGWKFDNWSGDVSGTNARAMLQHRSKLEDIKLLAITADTRL